ncbi:MAG: hypothetical protein R3C56_21595 [Pirellulaceae bacterium]
MNGGNASVVFDMDYADGLNRPDTSLNIFREVNSPLFGTQYQLVYSPIRATSPTIKGDRLRSPMCKT